MFWIIIIAYLAGALSVGLALVGVLCLMTAFARREEAAREIDHPHFGP